MANLSGAKICWLRLSFFADAFVIATTIVIIVVVVDDVIVAVILDYEFGNLSSNNNKNSNRSFSFVQCCVVV